MGTIDLQVNGFGGFDFNADPSCFNPEALHLCLESMRAAGFERFLATLITSDVDLIEARLRKLSALRAEDPLAREMIAGFHIEGPFISPQAGYVGAHPPECVRPAEVGLARRMLDAGEGLVKLITLAPECDPGAATIAFLVGQGVVVSAGHTAATLDELRRASDAGLSMFTHVGNGCPVTLPRHDHIINRALALADRLWLCFIPDGAHVPFFALRNYLRAAGLGRCIMVTDCISAAGLGPGTFPLGKSQVKVGEDLIARAPDGIHLAGSTLTMVKMLENLRQELGLDEAGIRRLTQENPAAALGI